MSQSLISIEQPTITSHVCKTKSSQTILTTSRLLVQNARDNKLRREKRSSPWGILQAFEKRSQPLFGCLGHLGVDRESTSK